MSVVISPTVLITGVASGIGLATAKLFQGRGWRVIGFDQLDKVVAHVNIYQQVDLKSVDSVIHAITVLQTEGIQLNALVNNAALQICKPILKTTLEDWDHIMAVNVRAPFILAKETHSLLTNQQGSIVNVASVHALATSANIAAYAASKGALVALTRAQAIEFAKDGVRVNAVLPGAVDTGMLTSGLMRGHLGLYENIEDLKKQLAAKTVLGTIGNPLHIAELIFFLADHQKSAFITGQTFVADGGALCRLSTE